MSVIRRWFVDGDGITTIRTQADRPLILDTLAEMRKAQPMEDREGVGRWALSVPWLDHLELVKKYPELAAKDGETRTRAWARFIASDESKPFRVREKI